MSNIACLLVFTTENSTITSWPPSITSLMPARRRSPLTFSPSMRSPYRAGRGACCWRRSRLSSDFGPDWLVAVSGCEFSPFKVLIANVVGMNNGCPSAPFAAAPLAIGCAFTRGAFCPTNGKGTTAGSTRKLPAALYCTRKSTLAGAVPIPLLTRSKLNWRPWTPEISKLVSALRSVTAFTSTSSGSRSECSTWNSAGSPTATAFTASGSRIAVTKCAAISTTVTFPSAVALVRTCGLTFGICALGTSIADNNQQNTNAVLVMLIFHLLDTSLHQLELCLPSSPGPVPPSHSVHIPLHIGGRIFQPFQKDWIFANVVCGCNQSEVPVELMVQPSQVSHAATDVFVQPKTISNAKTHGCLWHKLHQSHGALLGDRIRIPA